LCDQRKEKNHRKSLLYKLTTRVENVVTRTPTSSSSRDKRPLTRQPQLLFHIPVFKEDERKECKMEGEQDLFEEEDSRSFSLLLRSQKFLMWKKEKRWKVFG
jgi:hypothetical protein